MPENSEGEEENREHIPPSKLNVDATGLPDNFDIADGLNEYPVLSIIKHMENKGDINGVHPKAVTQTATNVGLLKTTAERLINQHEKDGYIRRNTQRRLTNTKKSPIMADRD